MLINFCFSLVVFYYRDLSQEPTRVERKLFFLPYNFYAVFPTLSSLSPHGINSWCCND